MAKALEAMTLSLTVLQQYKTAPLGAFCDAALRVLELQMYFCSLAAAQIAARVDWMLDAAAAAGCPGGVPVVLPAGVQEWAAPEGSSAEVAVVPHAAAAAAAAS